jgi:hypothetical protein
MMTATQQQQFLYKVWLPGQTPTSHEPTLTLHDSQAIRFFVESAANGSQFFLGKPFAIVAYYIVNELMERYAAEGTYRLQLEDGHVRLYTMYEAGQLAEYGGTGIISKALIDARMQIELDQVL